MSWRTTTTVCAGELRERYARARSSDSNSIPICTVHHSYDHFCFFCQINNSKKKKDEFAFFIFFTFKGQCRAAFSRCIRMPAD